MSSGMRLGWQVAAILMLVACLFMAWQSLELSLFDRIGPGSGFFPFWLSVLGAFLSATILVQVTREPATEAGRVLPPSAAARRVLAILVAIALAALLMEWLGFRIVALLFAFGLLAALGERRWWLIGLFAVVAGFGVYYVFNDVLDVLLPVGALGI